MKKLNLLVVVAIALSAATMLYVAKTMDAQGTTITTITINIRVTNGKIHVSQDPVEVYPNQQVAWASPDGKTFTVNFPNGGPFKAPSFSNAQNSNKKAQVPSGKPIGKAGTYKYSVKVGNITIDPQIIIR